MWNFWNQRSQRLVMRFQKFQKILKLQRKLQIGFFCFRFWLAELHEPPLRSFCLFGSEIRHFHSKLVFTIDSIRFYWFGGCILILSCENTFFSSGARKSMDGSRWLWDFYEFLMLKIARTPLKSLQNSFHFSTQKRSRSLTQLKVIRLK